MLASNLPRDSSVRTHHIDGSGCRVARSDAHLILLPIAVIDSPMPKKTHKIDCLKPLTQTPICLLINRSTVHFTLNQYKMTGPRYSLFPIRRCLRLAWTAPGLI